ncbi:MAG: glycosyl-transferase for dystroglycan-domain-containing protein, partial [Linnemannia elongata]
MHPTRVIPFYFKASFRDEDDDDDLHVDDHHGAQGSGYTESGAGEGAGPQEPVPLDRSLVTITTLITPNRYEVFLKLVKQYRGPISVATHIRKGPEQDAMFHELHAFFRDNSILRKYVDLHVIVDGVDFQLNMWRNVARMFARTDYFMMLDVDFHIPSSLKKNLHYDPRIQQLLASGAALVVPAFEYKVEHDPKDSKYFPETKSDLLPLLEKGHIHVFHDSFPPGHDEVDEQRVREEYLEHEADGERPYKVTKFEPKYEPYVILKKEGTPWCDERFVGYGANKAACLFEIYISGIDFWVMPEDFLIHQYHDYPTTDRKNGRILNRQLFVSFQQEVCFRTLSRMIVTGEWYTSKADNLRQQCRGFEGF